MKCFACHGIMKWQEIVVNTSWGNGPKVDVLVPGWQCEDCDWQVFDPMAVRVIQDIASDAEKVMEIIERLSAHENLYNRAGKGRGL